MPWWMKFYVRKPIGDDGDDTGGGASAGDDGAAGDGGGAGSDSDLSDAGVDGRGAGGGDAGAGGNAGDPDKEARKTGAALTDGIRRAIEEGLASEADADGDGKDGKSAAGGKAADAASKTQGAQPQAKKAGTEEDAGKAGAGNGKKPVKADDFALTAEDRKHLGPRSIGRHHELLKFAKGVEAERDQFREQNVVLQQARDNIVSVLRDTHTTQDDLSELLNFNWMIKTGQREAALQILDQYRNSLLQYLGKEGAGFDPIAGHADLMQMIESKEISREAALEVAQARATRSRQAESEQQAANEQRQTAAAKQEQETALGKIEQWNMQVAQGDPDYSKKAAILESKLKDIMTRYPPRVWAEAIADAYAAITVPAAQQGGGSARQQQRQAGPNDDGSLRPRGGVRPGAAAAGSLFEAVNKGLGYNFQQ